MIHSLIIFGATGDLTGRYLMPALADLAESGQLPKPFQILGVAQQPWERSRFRDHITEQLVEHARVSSHTREALVGMLEYEVADVTDPGQVAAAAGRLPQPVLAYLALPPQLFSPVLQALAAARLAPGSRVMIEKPFGRNLASAQALNRQVHASFPEEAVFRVDHFLGMPAVHNVLAVRLGNRLLEQVWSREHIERVECIWDETLALEGRASYYDGTGALRDMIQNHLLQVLCMVGMEPPSGISVEDVRDRKVELLRSVVCELDPEPSRRTRRARYAAGRIGRCQIPAYADEAGVDPSRCTETFVELELKIRNGRWAGVPFLLRSGKALARDRQEVVVHFKQPDAMATVCAAAGEVKPNRLHIPLTGPRLAVAFNVTQQADPYQWQPLEIQADYPLSACPSYSRLLLDALKGDRSRSVRDDEVEECWRILDPVLEAWAAGRVPLGVYPAGSEGPALAHRADLEISRTVS